MCLQADPTEVIKPDFDPDYLIRLGYYDLYADAGSLYRRGLHTSSETKFTAEGKAENVRKVKEEKAYQFLLR